MRPAMAAMCVCLALGGTADPPPVRVGPLFLTAGVPETLTIHAPGLAKRTLEWRVLRGRTPLGRGWIGVGADGTAHMTLRFPDLREGVALEGMFKLGETKAPLFQQKLWVYPKGFFAERQRRRSGTLQVYDPVGRTVEWLDQHDFPHLRVSDPERVGDGVLLVGEGLSVREHPGLFDQLRRFAASGARIVCLAPRGTEALFAGSTLAPPSVATLSDKRILRRVAPGVDEADFSFRFFQGPPGLGLSHGSEQAEAGWMWLELGYPGGGMMMVCGVELTASVSRSTPNLVLLDGILKRLYKQDNLDKEQPL